MATVRYTNIEGQIVAEKRGGTRSTYVPDVLGSTLAITGPTQSLASTHTYWPYGETAQVVGSIGSRFRFVGTFGYYSCSEDQLYIRARVLAVKAGRWMKKDPTVSSVRGAFAVSPAYTGKSILDGREACLSPYTYVEDQPTVKVDPSGLVSCWAFPPAVLRCILHCAFNRARMRRCELRFFHIYCECVQIPLPNVNKERWCSEYCFKKCRDDRVPDQCYIQCMAWCMACGPNGKAH
jgi:RHS repeat-associated protein